MLHFRPLPALCLLCAIFLLLSACALPSPPHAREVLAAVLDSQASPPSGRYYSLSAPPSEQEYPSAALLSALFGNGALPPAIEQVSDAAFFLSYNQPFEIALFLCRSASDTHEVAKICSQRLNTLKSTFSKEDAAAAPIPAGEVIIRGRWVMLCFASDPDAALRALKRSIG